MKDPSSQINKHLEKDITHLRRKSANYGIIHRHNKNTISPVKLLKQADLNVKNMLSSFLDTFSAEDKETYPIEQTLQIISESKSKSKNFNPVQSNNYHRNFLTKQNSLHYSEDKKNNSIDFENVKINIQRTESDEKSEDNLDNLRKSLIMNRNNKLLMTLLPINAIPFENKSEYQKLFTESCRTLKSYNLLCNEIRSSLFPKLETLNYCLDEKEPSLYIHHVNSDINEKKLSKSSFDVKNSLLKKENTNIDTSIIEDASIKNDITTEPIEPQIQTQRSGNNNKIVNETNYSLRGLFTNAMLTRSTHSLQQPLLQLHQQLQQSQLTLHKKGSSNNIIIQPDNNTSNNASVIANNTSLIYNNIKNTNIGSNIFNKHNITINTISEALTHEDDNDETKECSSILKEQLLKEKELKFRRCFRKSQPVYDSLSDTEEEEDLINIEEYIFIHPTSITRYVLDLLVLISTVMFLFISPLEIAFIHNLSARIFEIAMMNGMAEIIFIVDVILSFQTAYVDNWHDRLITQPLLMAKNYLCGWFFLDLIVGFPLNFYMDFYIYKNPNEKFSKETFVFYNNNTSNRKYAHLLKLIKVLKLYKVSCDNTIVSAVFDKAIHSRAGQSLLLIITLLFFIIFLHILACVFVFLGYNTYPSWITGLNLHPSAYHKIYIASFYEQTLTILGVGYGDIKLNNLDERLFALFPLTLGVLMYSWLVSALGKYRNKQALNAVLYQNNPKTLECIQKLEQLEMIRSEYKEIKHSLYKKIYRYLKSYLEKEKFNPNAIFTNLPSKLQKELLFAMYKPIIENFIFFKYFPNEDFIMRIILCLKPTICIKNERIVHTGDVMEEMIFVKKGKLALEMPIPQFLSQKLSQTRYLSTIAFTFKNKMSTKTTIQSVPSGNENSYNIYNDWIVGDCQFVKLIDIRKNEHYGDVVMFLNRRSHLSVRVSSKIAELFYLSKPDAVSIALNYPDIWRRIIMNSMKNLRQINKLSNKALEFFYQSNKVVLEKLRKQNEQYIHEIQQKEKDLILLKRKKKKLSTADIVSYFGKNGTYQRFDSANRSFVHSNQNNNENNVQRNVNVNDNSCGSSSRTSLSKNSSSTRTNKNNENAHSSQITQRSQLTSDASSRGLLSTHNNTTINNNNSNNNYFYNQDNKSMSHMLRKIGSPKNVDPFELKPPLILDSDEDSFSKKFLYNNNNDNLSLLINNELYDGESLLHSHRSEITRCKSAELTQTQIEENTKLYPLIKVKSLLPSNESSIITKIPENSRISKSIKPNQRSLKSISPTSPRKSSIAKIRTSKKFNLQNEMKIFDTTIKLIVPQSGGNTCKNSRKTTTNIDFMIKHKNTMRDSGIRNSCNNINKKKTKTRMDIITTNIENSCLNLNDPKSFYSEKFKAMIRRKGGNEDNVSKKHDSMKLHTIYSFKRSNGNSIDFDDISII